MKNKILIGFLGLALLVSFVYALPQIDFVSPTPGNATSQNNGTIYVNISTSDSLEHYSFLDFDNSVFGWWRGENNGNDDSGSGNTGTLHNGTIYSSGKFNQSFVFYGNGSYVSTSRVLRASNFTVSVWFNASSLVPSSMFVDNQWGGGASNWSWQFRLGLSDPTTIKICISNNTAWTCADSPSNMVQTGRWYHVAVAYDNTDAKVYLNGILNYTFNRPNMNYTPISSLPLAIGSNYVGQYSFNGSIDEVLVFNRTLSSNEILSLYNATANQYYNNFTSLVEANYTFKGYSVNTVGTLNNTEQITIEVIDNNYPIFSNYEDNNNNLTGSGIAIFNVSVINTNGTVWLTFNGNNYSASAINSSSFGVSVGVGSSGEYNYNWNAYGSGSKHKSNQSETRNYIVSSSTTSTNDGSGGSGGFISTVKSLEEQNGLAFKTFMIPNVSVMNKIKDDKGTGIKEIELKAKNWLSGEIYIVAYHETPDFCSILYEDAHKVYKVLDFNNTLDDDAIDSGRIKVGISKDWIYDNNISEIKFVRCYPEYNEVKSSYDSENKKEGIYNFYIKGFSAYAILGTFPEENFSKEQDIELAPKTESLYEFNWQIVAWIIGTVIIILIIVLLFRLIIRKGHH